MHWLPILNSVWSIVNSEQQWQYSADGGWLWWIHLQRVISLLSLWNEVSLPLRAHSNHFHSLSIQFSFHLISLDIHWKFRLFIKTNSWTKQWSLCSLKLTMNPLNSFKDLALTMNPILKSVIYYKDYPPTKN
jgi:hypothetical protein